MKVESASEAFSKIEEVIANTCKDPTPSKTKLFYYEQKIKQKLGTNISRPAIVAHAGFGKSTAVKREPERYLDIDDYRQKNIAVSDVQMMMRGQHIYNFICATSGLGKSHIVKNYNQNGMFVDIDSVMLDMSTEVDCPYTYQLRNNDYLSPQVQRYIKENFPKYVQPGRVYLVHNPDEVPEGGNILGSFSMPVYDKKAIEGFNTTKSPIGVPATTWRSTSPPTNRARPKP
jgi:hypothetical protein